MSEPKILIDCRDAALGYEGRPIWEHLTFQVRRGDYLCIVGDNGSGKSTLLKSMLGLLRPLSGEIRLDESLRRGAIGYLPQQTRAQKDFPATVSEVVLSGFLSARGWKFFYTPAQKSQALQHMGKLGILELKDKCYRELSGGQQQRVAIARALATHPKILLCDEATSALDPQTTQSILSLIRDIHDTLGITVIVITHQMSVVEQICTRVAILDNGAVAEEGAVRDVFYAPQSQAARRLVFPEDYEQPAAQGDCRIRVVFNGAEATRTPLIAQMAIEQNIAASILSASTRSLGDRAYGHMLLGIPGGKEQARRAVAYLRAIPDIYVEGVTGDAS